MLHTQKGSVVCDKVPFPDNYVSPEVSASFQRAQLSKPVWFHHVQTPFQLHSDSRNSKRTAVFARGGEFTLAQLYATPVELPFDPGPTRSKCLFSGQSRENAQNPPKKRFLGQKLEWFRNIWNGVCRQCLRSNSDHFRLGVCVSSQLLYSVQAPKTTR